MLHRILESVIYLWPLSEIVLSIVKRSRSRRARSEDRGSMTLVWLSIAIGVTLAFAARWVHAADVPVARSTLDAVALALMVGGIAVRWVAILTLGRFFTVDVAVHADHRIVDSGLYRFVRHPSYTGMLITFLGFGVFFGNWLSLIGLLLPIWVGLIHRVKREERALLDALGPAYADYCSRTRRFLPRVL